jgi:hypothetical protein
MEWYRCPSNLTFLGLRSFDSTAGTLAGRIRLTSFYPLNHFPNKCDNNMFQSTNWVIPVYLSDSIYIFLTALLLGSSPSSRLWPFLSLKRRPRPEELLLCHDRSCSEQMQLLLLRRFGFADQVLVGGGWLQLVVCNWLVATG